MRKDEWFGGVMEILKAIDKNFLPFIKLPLACLFAKSGEVNFFSSSFQSHTSDFSKDYKCLIRQTKREISSIKRNLTQAGYQMTQIVRVEVTLALSMADHPLDELYDLLRPFSGEIEIRYDETGLFSAEPHLSSSQLISIDVMALH